MSVPHLLECNYRLGKIGDPGCVCAVVNRHEIERLRAEVYHTAPGELEFGGEGWTWKQQARANEDRLRELEAEVARLGGVVAAAVQAEQAARERVAKLQDAIDAEPELPGEMPDEMWAAIGNDRDAVEEALRIAVRQTKANIRAALDPAPPAKEPTNG